MRLGFFIIAAFLANPGSAQADSLTTSKTAVVDFSKKTGAPKHLASGTLYGIPDSSTQIPSHFFSDMCWNSLRVGGSQTPGKGWIGGQDEYTKRFASVKANYATTKAHGGTFILILAALWGADGTQPTNAAYPGDNDKWDEWEKFLARVLEDLETNKMTKNLIIDIWNEPEYKKVFWNREQDQYLQMWKKAFSACRKKMKFVPISGPSTSGEPLESNTWWQNWAEFVAKHKCVPDQYSWHMEGGGSDLQRSTRGLAAIKKKYDLPDRPLNINEYAIFNEQVPAGSAWWIAQLERVDAYGVRGNWLSKDQLHDFLSSLLSKPGNPENKNYNAKAGDYFPNGDYQVYKFYCQKMTGTRVQTSPSADLKLDVYATVGSKSAIALVGVRAGTGNWTLELNKLSALGLPASGTVKIQTWGFPVASSIHYGRVDGPSNLGVYPHDYSGDLVKFTVRQTDKTTAYAFELSLK
ncbi:glycoside hydrolase superfamily [Melampsora americana]|nr:glycoside hydrolase superfamily [Melampsora americana]